MGFFFIRTKKILLKNPRRSELDSDSFCNDYFFRVLPKIFRWLIALFLKFFDIRYSLLLHFYWFQSETLKKPSPVKETKQSFVTRGLQQNTGEPKESTQQPNFSFQILGNFTKYICSMWKHDRCKKKLTFLMEKQLNSQFVPYFIILLSINHILGCRLRQPCVR